MEKRLLSLVTLALVASALLASPVLAAGKSAVTLYNKSDWDIHHFFLSPSDDEEWGPDQLGDHVLVSKESFELHGIPCDEYDVRLIDEDGDECVLGGVDVCGSDEGWVITNDDLIACEWGE
ncbi:MAG: hypothetical protein HC897_18150 [Thermoanaerobaculia bacterium]|nr:hypothetical protein [Thermoanaerobaculia bacterium]